VAVLLRGAFGAAGRVVIWTIGFLLAAMVGISRVYLDAQWPSDVLAGILLGLALTAVFAMIRNGFQDEVDKLPQVPIIAFVAFLAIASVKSTVTFEADVARATPRTSITEMTTADWLGNGWRRLPQQRIDLFGETKEVIFLQTAADPVAISAAFTAAGWSEAGIFQPTDFLYFLVPASPLDAFPPLPLLHGGRLPELSFTRPATDPERRLVVRLWSSDVAIKGSDRNRLVLVGSMTEEKVSHPYDALTVLSDHPAARSTIDEARRVAATIGAPAANVTERATPRGPIVLVSPRSP
jgi:undecaprenyl-diphosphatase